VKLAEFDYDLPEELIAQRPIEQRADARMLVSERLQHRHVRDLPAFLRKGDLLVFNDTRVIPARLQATKSTGGAVEVLLTQPISERRFKAMLRNANQAKPGTRFIVASDFEVEVEANEGGGFYRVLLHCDDALKALEQYGHIPLPPYIRRADDAEDRHTYQTMFAAQPGSSAAPTAGLHFTSELIAALDAQGVRRAGLTLHVGPGTFLPVREEAEEDVRQHKMHAEVFHVPQPTRDAIAETKRAGGRVAAVGTTSARTLENVALYDRGETEKWGRITEHESELFRRVDLSASFR